MVRFIILSKNLSKLLCVFVLLCLQILSVPYYAKAEFTIKTFTEIISAANTADEADTIADAGF